MKKIGKSLFMFICLTTGILISSWLHAAEDFIVTLGENKVFTAYNYTHTYIWNENDSGGCTSDGYTDGQTARAHVVCIPVVHDDNYNEIYDMGYGAAFSGAGVIFQTEPGPGQEEYVMASIEITFNYSTDINFERELGSAAVWIDRHSAFGDSYPPQINCGPTHVADFVSEGVHVNDSKSGNKTSRCEFPLFPGQTYAITANPYVKLHSASVGPEIEGTAEISIQEIKILFHPEEPNNNPPNASFNFSPSDPQPGEWVGFTSTSYDLDNDALSYSWSIHDNEGTTCATFDTESFSYTFDKEDAYKVKLIVSDGISTDVTYQIIGVPLPEPTVTPCTSQLSFEMHDNYQVRYAITNNARVPIVVDLTIEELRENLNQTLTWDPFTIDPAPKSSTIEVAIDAEQTQYLWFPDDDHYSHRWHWISPDCWMENYKVLGINYNQLNFTQFNSLQEILDWTKAVYQHIFAEIPTFGTVDYLLKGQASWWYNASVATYDLAVPDVNITIDIPPEKEEDLTNMRNEFAKAFVATKIYYLLVGDNLLLDLAATYFAIVECKSLKQSYIDFKEALDPPDYDYTSVVLPEPIVWPEIEALPDDQLPEFKAMLKKMLEQLSYKKAHFQTLAKYEGAMLSDDSEWKAVQLEKMHYYSRKIEESIAEQVALYQSVISHLPEITPEMINNAKQLLVNEGLPQIERDILTREMGLTETQIQELTEGLISSQDTWPQSYEEFKNFLLASLITTHSIAFEELSELIDVRINELKEAVIEPSAKDFEIIEEVRLELEAMMAAGDYSSAFLHKIEVLRDAYEELLKYTNNYSALEIYNQTLTNAFMSLKTDSIGDACDADGDGIPDNVDNCPESNLEQTIIIDSCDSEVENLLFEDGCTMSDLIAKCADGAKNHGKFVSGVSHLTNDWAKQKLISGKEKGSIQSCAAQADIP